MIREELDRRARLQSLLRAGVDPYPSEAHRTHKVSDVLLSFDHLEADGTPLTVAGRLIAFRDIGALSFGKLTDDSGVMQVVLRKADLDKYKFLVDHLDVGDFLEVIGKAFVTKTGEKSVLAADVRFLAKSIKPLPEKWHGLQDVEQRFRHRELDLISNPEVKERFIVRSRLVSAMRRFLENEGYLEVETPILQPIPGGASAKPFVTHHNALSAEFYLRIAPELYLKRLIVGGFEKIFEIGRCFRNEGIDYAHNPEFTMLELYSAYTDKESFIELMERLIVESIAGSGVKAPADVDADLPVFAAPFKRLTFREAILADSGIDIDALKTEGDVADAAKKAGLLIDFSKCTGFGEYLDELWKKSARPKIVQPTWIFDYPVELKPLARRCPGDKSKSACVQLVVLGAEIVNAYYYELNDPTEQRARLEEQQQLREKGSEEAQWLDEDFLDALDHGMPPTSGFGIGIDRLVSLITNAQNLKEVILFPTLKPEAPKEYI